MTDLEIIKQIEEEINRKLEINKNYKIDEESNVISLDLTDLDLDIIPDNVFQLKKLRDLSLQDNEISDFSKITLLDKLDWLSISQNNFKDKDLEDILINMKSLEGLYAHGNSQYYYLSKALLNHDLLLNPAINYEDTGFFFESCDFFPPYEMIGLGYRKPNFYLNNYQQTYIDKFIEIYDRDIKKDTKETEFKRLRNQMVSELLKIFYSDYEKNENLPYAIRKFSILDFYEIEHLSINNIGVKYLDREKKYELNDPKWIFITGENGYGKTLLLQSIVIGLNGDKDGNNILTQEGHFYLEFKNNDTYTINAVSSYHENYTPFQHFVAYGPARLVKKPGYEKDNKTASLFKPYSELIDIEERLIAWEKDEHQSNYYKSAKDIIGKLLEPQIKDIVIKRKGTDTYVRYIENYSEREKSFDELASGYRSIITMIGDLIIRLSKHQPEINDFTKLAGIVLIDEIDLHLHPKWQKAMVEKLTDTFKKIQFIASTHSPIPILGAPVNTIIINVQRSDRGITAKKLDVDFKRLLPNSLLSSPIFSFDEIIAKNKPKDKFPHTEDDYDKIVEKEKLQKEIAEFLGDKSDELLNLINTKDDAENK